MISDLVSLPLPSNPCTNIFVFFISIGFVYFQKKTNCMFLIIEREETLIKMNVEALENSSSFC